MEDCCLAFTYGEKLPPEKIELAFHACGIEICSTLVTKNPKK
jgi:hypothetical protein